MRVLLALLSIAVLVPPFSSAWSAPPAQAPQPGAKVAKQTIRGKLILGTLEGVIETAGGTMYSFWSKGGIARKLTSGCNDPDEFCEADIIAEHQTIKKVLKVRKVLSTELTSGERGSLKLHLTRD